MGRVLVVDDEPLFRKVAVLVLETAGFRAREAADGHEALVMAEASEPDVVLTDLHMPKMSGRELVRRLVERFGARNPTVVGASADLGLVERLREHASFHAVLSKPVDPSLLTATVEEALREGRGSPPK